MRKRLTATQIEAFACSIDQQQAFLRDTDARGLAVRATRAGAKSFVLETTLHGRNVRLTIGDVRTWQLGQARVEARRLLSLIDQGIDPRIVATEQKAKAEAARADEIRRIVTVGEAWAEYVTARQPKWSERSLLDHKKLSHAGGVAAKRGNRVTEPGPLAVLMPLRLCELTGEVVETWLANEVTRRPTQAALAYRLLRAFLNWCADRPSYSGVAHSGACNRRMAKDTLPRQTAKKDSLQREQLSVWFAAVTQIANPVISAYLQGLLITGARREELLGLQWHDVDFRWKSLLIRDKVEGERVIPLTPYFESLLLDLKLLNDAPSPVPRNPTGAQIGNDQTRWDPSPWVFFSSKAESGRLQEPSIQHRRATACVGLEGLTLHGLRRSFGTLAEWVECPAGVSAQIMGHKPSAIAEKHYRVRPLDLLRVWHIRIEQWMLEQAGIAFNYAQEQPAPLRVV